MDTLDGAYSLVLMSPQKLMCARDPYGFRPLCFGKTKDGVIVIASESCALKAVGAKFIRDVEPGEILVFSKDGMKSRKEHCGKQSKRLCIFEYALTGSIRQEFHLTPERIGLNADYLRLGDAETEQRHIIT